MANIVIFDEGATPQRVLKVSKSIHEPPYFGRSDVLIDPDLSSLIDPSMYWKHESGLIVGMTAQEKLDEDTRRALEETIANRLAGEKWIDAKDATLLRAIVILIRKEINKLRVLHGLSEYTNAQVITAIKNEISSGEAD